MASRPDPVFAPLLADPRTALRPPRDGLDLDEYRRRLDTPMAAVRGPDLHAVEILGRDATGVGVPMRVYAPVESPTATILFIHGGGFVMGSLETHDAMCRTLAKATAARVVALDYRLAPESPFPAARDDCRAALHWAATTAGAGAPLAICGDSAGGHLAVGTALSVGADGISIAALGLLYPVADPVLASPSWAEFGAAHVLTRAWMAWAWTAYLGGADPALPAFTLRRADLAGLPPTRIVTAACDPLRDEGEALGAAIVAAGGQASVTCTPGMIHGFASLPMLTPVAYTALEDLAGHFRQHMC